MKKEKTVFVTGATGRLGRVFVRLAKRKGWKVTALVRNLAKAKEVLPKGVEFVQGDLDVIAFDDVCRAVRGKSVVHIAGVVDFRANAERFFRINAAGTLKMVQAAERERVPRFVHASSTSIYHYVNRLPITEEFDPSPANAYGKSKLEAERIVSRSHLDYVIIRPPAIYGPGFEEGFTQVMRWVKKGKMPVLGSGKNRIPLIHVDDVAQALWLALENRKIHQEDFIVTSGEEYSQEESLDILADALNAPRPTLHVSKPVAYALVGFDAVNGLFTGKRKLLKTHVDFLMEDRMFDISKAKRVLGFRPSVTLRKGIRQLVRNGAK